MFKLKILVVLLLGVIIFPVGLAQGARLQATPAATEAASGSAESYLVNVSSSQDLGKFLVGEKGMTLYVFTVDPLNDSACYEQCAKAWPPLIVKNASDITAEEEIPGKFATITRKDGSLQVTYNGMPLYYWFKDTKAGDTTGNRVGHNWWVVPPAAAYAQELPKGGNLLVGANGMTLYTYSKDTADTSNCYDKCAENWPPLMVKSEDDLVPGVNLLGKFATAKRKDGTLQVTYNGQPLYYYVKDKAVGDITGDKVGNVWFVVVPETVGVSKNKDLGDLLITADGMTLYTYAKDSANTSTCTGDCAKNWPPYWVYNADQLKAGAGVSGKLGTIKLNDKEMQVTYNGMPLYLYAQDKAPGDAKGQNVGNSWTVVKP